MNVGPAYNEWSEGEIESVSACPVCGCEIYGIVFSEVSDLEEGVAGSWSFSECHSCKSLFLNPRPTPRALSKAYETYYTHQAPVAENRVLRDRSVVARIARGYLAKRYGLPRRGDEVETFAALLLPLRLQLDYFMRHLPRHPGRLLDLGCGSGGFMARAAEAGWQVEGVEPDVVAAGVARSGGRTVHSSIDALTPRSFDVITLSHVIEHLHEPTIMLERVRDLLVPRGAVWIATPNVRGLGLRLYGRDWQALEAPRHLAIPSARGMRELLEGAGFCAIRFLRRGRGAAKRFAANEARATHSGKRLRVALASGIVDSAATLSPFAGEEIVVMAQRA